MEEEKKNSINAAYAIIRDLIKFSEDKGLQSYTGGSLYNRLTENYKMGLIYENDYPNENKENLVYKIEIENNYIIISFSYMSMIVSEELMEGFICEKWQQTRSGIHKYINEPELRFIKEKGFGIKIKAFAGIGGEDYNSSFATLFTPDDIKRLSFD